MTTLAHISDLHFGTETPELVEGLLEDLQAAAPSIVVASGDLTQRARRREFVAARAFLDRILFPKLVIPGNHDLPLFNVVARLVAPLARFRRYISEEVDPFIELETMAVLGLNTARADRWKEGRVSDAQIETLRRRMNSVQPGVVKVLVTHHPFLPPPGVSSLPLVGRAARTLHVAESCGVDLMLAGHLHLGYTGDVRQHHTRIHRAILVAQAGTAVSRRVRDESNSYNLIDLAPERIAVSLRAWKAGRFQEASSAEYVKRQSGWEPSAGSAPTAESPLR